MKKHLALEFLLECKTKFPVEEILSYALRKN